MFCKIFQEELAPNLYGSVRKNEELGILLNSFCEAIILLPKYPYTKPDKGITSKYNCKPISLKNVDTKIFNKMLAKENDNIAKRFFMTKWGFSQSTSALEHLKINTQNVTTISIDYKREPYHHPDGCMPHDGTMIPKCIHALIPVTCEYVTGHGRSYFADVIK